MKRIRIATCLLTAALIAAALAGCGDAVAKTSDNTKQEQSAPRQEKATMAKVVSLEGDQLTVVLSDMQRGMGDGSQPGNGTPPAMNAQSENGTPPAMNNQQGNGSAPGGGQTPPDGAAPPSGNTPPDGSSGPASGAAIGGNGGPGGGQGGGEITFTGEQTTYTLSDDVTIMKGTGDSASEIDLSELKTDDVIRFTTITNDNGDEVIDSIAVMQ